MHPLFQFLAEKTRGFFLTIIGTITGYIPQVVDYVKPEVESLSRIERINLGFQYVIWSITIIIGILTVISLIQKIRQEKSKKP